MTPDHIREIEERLSKATEGRPPKIEIDKEAIRFEFVNGDGTNLFWINLFSLSPYPDWKHELMQNIFRAYNECVLAGKGVEIDDEDDSEQNHDIPDLLREVKSLRELLERCEAYLSNMPRGFKTKLLTDIRTALEQK